MAPPNQRTKVEQLVRRIQDNKLLSALIVFGIAMIAVSKFTTAAEDLWKVARSLLAAPSPAGSELVVKSYEFNPDTISVFVENHGNRPGHIGKLNVVLYCKGAYFSPGRLSKEEFRLAAASGIPIWGVNIDLGTSPQTSRTIPEQSSREISFILSGAVLHNVENGFPKVGQYPAGDFRTVLYDESIRINITAELWNFGDKAPRVVNVTPIPDPPFWRGFTAITQTF